MKQETLKAKILESLQTQGFYVNGQVVPNFNSKGHYKQIQQFSRCEQVNLQKEFLQKNISKVEKYLLNGWDVNPHEIELEIRPVNENSVEEILFRWWNLVWWSVPYQKAYGRQMRLLLWDKKHNAPFGLIGLQSPILRMSVRDKYLEIPKSELDYYINQSMQAQRLGALPPYNQIIGGKMVALAMTSNEVRKMYKEKYSDSKTVIKKRYIEPNLLFLTTTSAFGKSSIYNRLKFNDQIVAKSLGYTKGSGSFHIPQSLYDEIRKFLHRKGINTETTFGFGPSRKVKILDTAFSLLSLRDYHFHNIQRELFIFPIAKNLKNVISRNSTPVFYNRPLKNLTSFWLHRWATPRFERNFGWLDFDADSFINNVKIDLSTKKV